jgi:uncharacterized phage protein (TIGR01671 family)
MNREIKFRAWDGGTKHMTKGKPLKESCEIARDQPDWYWDDSVVIIQYTGLKDKNGKEIYEGDVLRDRISGVVWVVKFGLNKKAGYIGWYVENEEIERTSTIAGDYGADQNSYVEVIGNIYENPELLKEAAL